MNQRDRNRLAELVEIMGSIPFPHDGSGTSTASLKGMVTFQNDMRRALPRMRDCVIAIARADSPHEDPDGELRELRAWLDRRKAAGWE